ncbi:hypothetical protein NDU88_003142 [Pleurodeles waltl]|uniref:Uncharacterized protein n=1 Tax=Pleurodeles waltl TaxID=8319 RepID=A0AAV7NFR6_PLEWA|nr:hypothetical protein NDU88_003142 [Pleurodeles waltl]
MRRRSGCLACYTVSCGDGRSPLEIHRGPSRGPSPRRRRRSVFGVVVVVDRRGEEAAATRQQQKPCGAVWSSAIWKSRLECPGGPGKVQQHRGAWSGLERLGDMEAQTRHGGAEVWRCGGRKQKNRKNL